jgi:hypothetical protein
MREALAIALLLYGSYALLAALGLLALLIVTVRSIRTSSRESTVPVLKIGLVGGLVFTSGPFHWSVGWLDPVHNYLFYGADFLKGNVFGWSSWYPHWLAEFTIGFLAALIVLFVYRKVRSARARTNTP